MRASDNAAGKGLAMMDWLWILLVGLLVQAFWAARIEQPTYMDAYYYASNGQRLAAGYGFTEMVVWQFLDEPEGLPAPSHTYWMPLPSLLAAAGYRLLDHFYGAQLPFWLLAGSLPLLSYIISQQLSGVRWQAWTAALLTASGGFYNVFFNQPTTFAPFAWAGGACLLFLALAHRQPAWYWWLLAGLTAGLAHLTRADGMLLLMVGLFVGLIEIRDWRLEIRLISNFQSSIVTLGLLLVGYFLVMGGWFIRNWLVLGRPLATAGTQTIFLTTYDDLFAYGRSFDLSYLVTWGWGNILRSRLEGVSLALQTFVAVGCLIFLTPFVLWAWVVIRRNASRWLLLRPVTWYALTLLVTMSLIFTFPGGRGGLFHSSAALWPWLMALAAAGIDLAVNWTARYLRHWRPERASRIFAGLFVVVAFAMSFALALPRAANSEEGLFYEQIANRLPAGAVVMVGDAPGFYYHTGLAAVSVPNEPVEVLLQAAARYNVTYLILDENRPQPLDVLYGGQIASPHIRPVADFDDIRVYQLWPEDE